MASVVPVETCPQTAFRCELTGTAANPLSSQFPIELLLKVTLVLENGRVVEIKD
jgi:hypothetical protein